MSGTAYRWLIVLAFVLAFVLAACGGGQTITGTFTLTDNDGVDRAGEHCQGNGGYSDIREGLDVVVRDGEGTTIGSASLVTDRGASSATECVYTFEVKVKDAEFYEVEVGNRGALTYSKEELEAEGWTVGFTLGD